MRVDKPKMDNHLMNDFSFQADVFISRRLCSLMQKKSDLYATEDLVVTESVIMCNKRTFAENDEHLLEASSIRQMNAMTVI